MVMIKARSNGLILFVAVKCHSNLEQRSLQWSSIKYIGFDIDDKKTVACVSQKGKKERYKKTDSHIESTRKFLKQQNTAGCRLHLTFEVSGQAGFLYDSLEDYIDPVAVSNPSQMTWIYRTSKETDRIDAHKQALLLSVGEIPRVRMPSRRIRQWRDTIQHRRRIIGRIVRIKNRIRALLKSQGHTQCPAPVLCTSLYEGIRLVVLGLTERSGVSPKTSRREPRTSTSRLPPRLHHRCFCQRLSPDILGYPLMKTGPVFGEQAIGTTTHSQTS
ncbi:MAG: transposase [Phycisphaerales bacterium]|nr:MAG: transposase [Phycisphaerales bacterium]